MTVPSVRVLTCREVVEHVSALLGDALDHADRARLEQHLLVCPPCTLHVAQLRATIELTRELAPAPLADDAALAAFRAWKAR